MSKALKKRYFGAHVSCAGGLVNAIHNGNTLGINTIQFHPSPPQRWNTKPFDAGIEDEFLAAQEASTVEKIFFHGIYLINLATPDAKNQRLSKLSLEYYLDLMARVKGEGVIFHLGSLKDEPDEQQGYVRAAQCINDVLARAKNNARLILEVAAGSGKVIGDRLEELAAIYELVEDKSRVGFGLDSQHLWASGYNLRDDLEQFVSEVDKILGLDRVLSFHLNDSMTALGSRRDRHANLGEGELGLAAMQRIFMHPRLASIPFILETPALKSLETAAGEVEQLRSFLKV